MSDFESMRARFSDKIDTLKSGKGNNHQLFTVDEYYAFLMKVKITKDKTSHKTSEEYQRLSRYDIVKIGNVEKLVVPVKNDRDPIVYYVFMEETFDIIHETHISIGHGGRNRMMKKLKTKYKNITVVFVKVYLNLCVPCQKKISIPKKDSL
ncbi:KRAB-A domain-containing protein 2-like [Diabrotica undecimpunctata]|uniref:KRAB-A domain-containing protein 2-like n=1 Tax=Diabrotica undecimpunctata TaxID=50387 RepID=UPI003B6384C8